MKKNILVISSSLRKNSNSERLAEEFVKGAEKAGHQVELISLREKQINFCTGCLACQKTFRCVMRDDGDQIAQKMGKADVLVFATPIYYYELSGQLKTLLDRANPLFPSDYAFREVYLLMTAADSAPRAMERAIQGMGGWIECFEKASLKGTLSAGGVNGAGEIEGNPALQKAYQMGLKA